MTKNTIIAIFIAIGLITFAFIFTNKKGVNKKEKDNSAIVTPTKPVNSGSNSVTIKVKDSNGKEIVSQKEEKISEPQIVEIQAKGGYTPRKSIAKAGVPTIIRFNTNGTFDCSSSVRIPSMSIYKSLPMSGTTDIDLGVQKVGTLNGSCGMGMYPFEIEFQ